MPGRPKSPPRPAPVATDAPALRAALRAWFMLRRRRLPWRDDPSPYRVWVSEIMLQQTQVATVIPYFERFIQTFPTVQHLASADLADVLLLWSGLGYYRRARMLHAAARAIVDEHGGALPATLEGLESLPGVGRYTAGAIASIAFGIRAPVLDGNVTRVLSRLVALIEPTASAPAQHALWALADDLVAPDHPSDHNQALMELGALVCTPTSPDCPACPWSPHCAAHRAGTPEAFPKKSPKAAPQAVQMVAGLLHRSLADDAILLARRPIDGLFGGLWELPAADLATPRSARKAALARTFRDRLALDVTVGDHLGSLTHQLTHRTIGLDLYRVILTNHAARPHPTWYTEARWLPLSAPDSVPLSTLTKKALAAVAAA